LNKSEFDRFADECRAMHAANIRLSAESSKFFAENKVRHVARYCERIRKVPAAILDFGCGVGNSIPQFRHHAPTARLTGAH
jgi:trans-aconitate methyltransferase